MKTAWSMQSSVGVLSKSSSAWAEEEIRRVKINFASENFEGQDEVSSEASAFQREEVELARPFLIWHVTETSHQPCCNALDPLQLFNISSLCRGVGFHCILQVWPHYGTVQRDKSCFA